MASYFPNSPSQSRFLANSASGTTTATMTSAPKPVRQSSKLFATSLIADGEKDNGGSVAAARSGGASSPSAHPLRSTWVFWFRQQRAPGNKITNYEEGIKKIAAFSTVESFWSLWTHLYPPSALLPTTDYLLFHERVRRPVWEDPLNLSGGKWIIRLRKGVADRLWEDLVLGIVGDQFAGVGGTDGDAELPDICGATISVRQNEDIVSIWNRVEADQKLRERIRDNIRRVLNLPSTVIMEYKSNNDSMQDKSSFRTAPVTPSGDRTPIL